MHKPSKLEKNIHPYTLLSRPRHAPLAEQLPQLRDRRLGPLGDRAGSRADLLARRPIGEPLEKPQADRLPMLLRQQRSLRINLFNIFCRFRPGR